MFKFHIPTEQYGYIEVDVEAESIGEAMATYQLEVKNVDGLNDKEFNAILDEYLETGTVRDGNERYLKLNTQQKITIQIIKRALKRIEYKNKI